MRATVFGCSDRSAALARTRRTFAHGGFYHPLADAVRRLRIEQIKRIGAPQLSLAGVRTRGHHVLFRH